MALAATCSQEKRAESHAVPAQLDAAIYWRIPDRGWPSESPLVEQVDRLATLIAAQALEAGLGSRFNDATHIITTTSLSQAFQVWPALRDRLMERIAAVTGVRPEGLIQAYLCTGWAFAMRACSEHTQSRRLVITIADVDFHDFAYLRYHPLIGKQGYGLTTLSIDLPQEHSIACWVDGPFPNNGFKEMLLGMRERQKLSRQLSVYPPFLKPELRRIVEKSLTPETVGPDLHASHGHCFGSDPWLGLIHNLGERPVSTDMTALVGSFAYTGYIGIAEIQVSAKSVFAYHELQRDLAAPNHHVDTRSCQPV